MAGIDQNTLWQLASMILGKTKAQPTTSERATFLRTDPDGTQWVRLPSSNDETPVNGRTLATAKAGDTVEWSIDNGRLSITGNASSPSVGGTYVTQAVAPVEHKADSALAEASRAKEAADTAESEAYRAHVAADAAQTSADEAAIAASDAQTSANEALASARSANTHAVAALNSLATVENVVDTLTWITKHGAMTLTTDTAVDPSKVYFVSDASGQYVVGGGAYSIVQNPTTEGLSGYYELAIDKSVENYIATHVAVTEEGLWLTPTSSNGYRVLIATGAGSTYTTAGTYIINASGIAVAQFTTTNVRIGIESSGYVLVDSSGMTVHNSDGIPCLVVSSSGGTEALYKKFLIGGTRVYARTSPATEMYSVNFGRPYEFASGAILNIVLRGYAGGDTFNYTCRFEVGTSSTVNLQNSLNKANYQVYYDGAHFAYLRRTSSAENDNHTDYYYQVFYAETTVNVHAPSIAMDGSVSDHAPYSSSFGEGLLASSDHQTVLGRYNVEDANDSNALIIGNGLFDDSIGELVRSNALTVGWDGSMDVGPQELTDSGSGIRVHGSNVSTTDETASASFYGLIAGGFDSGGNLRSYLKHVDLANGNQGVQVETRRSVNGSNVYNGVQMHVAADGTRTVVLNDRAAWLSALGYTAPTALPLASGCVAYSSGQTPRYARDGHVVSVQGAVKPTSEVAAGGTLDIGTLPAGFRPSQDVYVLCQGSGQNKWVLTVSTSGVMTASRYSSGATSAAMPTNVWLPFCATFITTS